MAGGNFTISGSKLTQCTADPTTSKIVWSGVLSTGRENYVIFDINNMYLYTPFSPEDYIYLHI